MTGNLVGAAALNSLATRLAKEPVYVVVREQPRGVWGSGNWKGDGWEVEISPDCPPRYRPRVWAHELGHIALGHNPRVDLARAWSPAELAEMKQGAPSARVLADAIATKEAAADAYRDKVLAEVHAQWAAPDFERLFWSVP